MKHHSQSNNLSTFSTETLPSEPTMVHSSSANCFRLVGVDGWSQTKSTFSPALMPKSSMLYTENNKNKNVIILIKIHVLKNKRERCVQKSGNSLFWYKKLISLCLYISYNEYQTYHKTKLTNQTFNILLTVNRSDLLKVIKCELKKLHT